MEHVDETDQSKSHTKEKGMVIMAFTVRIPCNYKYRKENKNREKLSYNLYIVFQYIATEC